jgi:dihydroorotase-like cyclic amidohydrolase
LTHHLALNPAKIAGLHPRKGTIRKGADADLVVLELNGKERPVRSSLSDVYEAYEGKTTSVVVKQMMLRGETIVRDGILTNRQRFTGKRV